MSSTDIEPSTGTDLATAAGPGSGVDGLDEVSTTDLAMPILRIDHSNATFIDSLTNEVFPSLRVVLLGLTKQRILWPLEPGEAGEKPLCRSYEYRHGVPNPDKWDRAMLTASGFTRDRIESGEPLPCDSCKLKEWNTNPKTGGTWCNEQYTLPLLILRDDVAPSPAVISFVRTGIKPVKNYVSGFVQGQRPLYTAITLLTLSQQRKGSVDYAVPRFAKESDTDPTMWPRYSEAFHGIRDYLQTPRTRDDADTGTTGSATPAAKAPSAPAEATEVTPPSSKRATPAPPRPTDEDEEPF